MPGPAGPFSREERIWIVLKFGEVKSATLVRRAFQKKFPSPNPKDVPHRKVFARVLEKFEGCGDVGDPKQISHGHQTVRISIPWTFSSGDTRWSMFLE